MAEEAAVAPGNGGGGDVEEVTRQVEGLSMQHGPPLLKAPEPTPVDIGDRPLVYWDLDTTGLGIGNHGTWLSKTIGLSIENNGAGY